LPPQLTTDRRIAKTSTRPKQLRTLRRHDFLRTPLSANGRKMMLGIPSHVAKSKLDGLRTAAVVEPLLMLNVTATVVVPESDAVQVAFDTVILVNDTTVQSRVVPVGTDVTPVTFTVSVCPAL
jgi:hypothetical protein